MEIAFLEDLLKRVRTRPIKTTILVIVALLIGAVCLWASGFFSELGRQSAARHEDNDALVPANSETQQTTPFDPTNEARESVDNTKTTQDVITTTVNDEKSETNLKDFGKENGEYTRVQTTIREASAAEVVWLIRKNLQHNNGRRCRELAKGYWTYV